MTKLEAREQSRDSIANQSHVSKLISKEEVTPEVLSETPKVAELEQKVAEPEQKVAVSEQKATELKPEPKRKGRPVVNRETKKRFTLTLLPSIYDAASSKASEQGKSLSEVVGDFLSEYIKSNQ